MVAACSVNSRECFVESPKDDQFKLTEKRVDLFTKGSFAAMAALLWFNGYSPREALPVFAAVVLGAAMGVAYEIARMNTCLDSFDPSALVTTQKV